jgi:hypothetical protein
MHVKPCVGLSIYWTGEEPAGREIHQATPNPGNIPMMGAVVPKVLYMQAAVGGEARSCQGNRTVRAPAWPDSDLSQDIVRQGETLVWVWCMKKSINQFVIIYTIR